jgi:quercetin dioxygenase-like cupin family protein
MSLTFIDTNKIPPVKVPGAGEFAEIMGKKVCGAKNVVGNLRWLKAGDNLALRCEPKVHQLAYIMAGEGVITLNGKDYDVAKGNGIYLGPNEAASIRQRGAATLKLFQLIVPELK